MTKRLAISMLCTVWAILIASGVTAYWTTRSVLLANLDAALFVRAGGLNETEGFAIKSDGKIVQSSMKGGRSDLPHPQWVDAKFFTADDGTRFRIATVRVFKYKDGNVVPEEV